MRMNMLREIRWPQAPRSRLAASGVALALVAGLTATAVSEAAASGTPPVQSISVLGGPGAAGNPAVPGGPAGGAAAAAGGTTTAAGKATRSSVVVLPTGDQVRLDATQNGGQQATPIPAGTVQGKPKTPSTFVQFSSGGDQYVVPDAAVPYLHSTLDPRLFDVSYLARLGTAGISTRIAYTSQGATASLPGVLVTHRSGSTANATISGTQAGGLGHLLAAQWQAARTGHSATPAGKLPGISHIGLAPQSGVALPSNPLSTASAAGQGLAFYTLTLNFTDLNGNPGTFLGFTQNVDNVTLDTSETSGSGSESLSVPQGTYSLEFSILTPDPSGSGFDTALVIKPQVTVDSNTTISLDARTAVPYQAAPATPVNASVRSDVLGFTRASVTGGETNLLGLGGGASMRLYAISPNPIPSIFADRLLATPTTQVTKGSFLFDAFTALTNTILGGSQGTDPSYVFDFPHQGSIPSSLTYTVHDADLTTVNRQIYNPPTGCDPSGKDYIDTFLHLPLGGGLDAGPAVQLLVPAGDRTDYWYSGDPQLDRWQDGLVIPAASGLCNSRLLGAVQAIAPGQQISAVWDKWPLVPSTVAPSTSDLAGGNGLGSLLTYCAACRQDDNGTLNLLPFADSDPSHHADNYLSVPQYNSTLSLYRNGTLAFDSAGLSLLGQADPIGLELPMLSQAAAYELDWTETLTTGTGGPTIGTDWTFRSGPDGPAANLPATEQCAPDPTRSCSFLPLLFPRFDLALNGDNQATAGTQEQINFTVTGQQNAPAPSGLSATVSASFDGGKTWTTPQAATGLGHGQFTTTISQPALASTDGFVALRVTATDGSGDGVTQTITNAYGLTS